jgi:rhodanese-related sulfurtransferase
LRAVLSKRGGSYRNVPRFIQIRVTLDQWFRPSFRRIRFERRMRPEKGRCFMKTISFLILIFMVSIIGGCQSIVTDIPSTTAPSAEAVVKEISPAEAKPLVENRDAQFIDVRTEAEYAGGHAPGAMNFPLDKLAGELGKLDKTKPVYVICQTGRRSKEGAQILTGAGFAQVFSIAGGTSAWTAAGLPVEKVSADTKSKLDERTEKALLAALADERQAQAVYGAVLDKFGDARPFSNIVGAEKRHEAQLLPLFEKYGVKVPQNEFTKEKVQLPETLAEACRKGVEGEKANIALYDGFLEFVRETDIRDAFVYLREASKNNHLPAFERCGGQRGGGRGLGRGRNF